MAIHFPTAVFDEFSIFTNQQAALEGYTQPEIRRATAPSGPWVRLRKGVFIPRKVYADLDQTERLLAGDIAAHLNTEVDHVLSHDSAARLHGMALLRVPQPLAHITRPDFTGTRSEYGVKHHIGRLAPQIGLWRTVPTTGLARTAIDVAREHGFLHGVVACDAALRYGAEPEDFVEVLAHMNSWPNVTRARRAVKAARHGAESIAETLGRLVADAPGFEEPVPQYPIAVDGQIFWIDLRLGRLLIEVDGARKYRRVEDGGLANDDPSEVVISEKRREEIVCGENFLMARVMWDDVWGGNRDRTRAYLLKRYSEAMALFGPVPELPPQLRRRREQRIRRFHRPDSF